MAKDAVTIYDYYLPEIAPPEGVRLPSESDIFGAGSTAEHLWTGEAPLAAEPYSLVRNYAFETLLVVVFLLFCYLIYNFRNSILLSFRVMVMRIAPEKAFEEQTLFFRRFMAGAMLLEALLVTGFLTGLADRYGLARLLPDASPLVCHGFVVAVLVAVYVVSAYKKLLSRMIGAVVQNPQFFKEYAFLSRLSGAAAALIMTPLFLMLAFASDREFRTLFWIAAGVFLLLTGVFLSKSYRFFVERNISILQWILYLCAVEIFPVSFFLLAGSRLI